MEKPESLGPRGGAFWAEIAADFDLSPAERELLVEVCRTLDALEYLATVPSKVGEARQQRLVLHRLLAALNLPAPEAVESSATLRARKAAGSRWAGHEKREVTDGR